MVPWEKNITIASFEKNDHRWSLNQTISIKKIQMYFHFYFPETITIFPLKLFEYLIAILVYASSSTMMIMISKYAGPGLT